MNIYMSIGTRLQLLIYRTALRGISYLIEHDKWRLVDSSEMQLMFNEEDWPLIESITEDDIDNLLEFLDKEIDRKVTDYKIKPSIEKLLNYYLDKYFDDVADGLQNVKTIIEEKQSILKMVYAQRDS